LNKKNRETEQMSLAETEEGAILARLSERVEKAVQTIQELRRERDALKSRLETAEAQLEEHGDTATRAASLEEDNDRFQRERGEIRERIETILSSLESLDRVEEQS
jgi:FtsZ-binding cell division protein ZapB